MNLQAGQEKVLPKRGLMFLLRVHELLFVLFGQRFPVKMCSHLKGVDVQNTAKNVY